MLTGFNQKTAALAVKWQNPLAFKKGLNAPLKKEINGHREKLSAAFAAKPPLFFDQIIQMT